MKKLILLFLLFYSFAYSQVDTANWSFLPNQTNGKFTALISRELYYGISGGQYKQMSLSATSYDSTVFQLIPNQLDGRYTMIENIATYYGKDSGTVQIPIVFDIGSANISFDTSLFVKRSAFSQSIEATGGDITLLSSLGNVVITSNGLAEDDGGRIGLTANASMTIITGAQFNIFCSDAVSIGASEDITFRVGSGKNYGFDNMAVVDGSAFGTADGYITIKINGGTLIDIPYKTH